MLGNARATALTSWHNHGFIPELRLGDRVALIAWKKAPLSPKAVIVNFCDLTMRAALRGSRIRKLKRELRESETLILSTVGPDELLDHLSIERLHDTALRLDVDWVITPDDYVYEADGRYPFYQDSHFSRSILRALQLLRMAKGHYGIIGLAIGSSLNQLQEFVTTMEEYEVNNFAFACGDVLKQGRRFKRTTLEIGGFIKSLKASKHNSLLLGIDSPHLLRILDPDNWASSAWSIDASHWRYYARDGTRRKGYRIVCDHDVCRSGELKGMELFGVHNLLADRDLLLEGRN